MNREQKSQIAEELGDIFARSAVTILADFQGLTVNEMTELRREFKRNEALIKVVKNTLAIRAIEGRPMADLFNKHLKGPTAVAYSFTDPVAPAKVLTEFAKDKKGKPAIKVGFLEGQELDEEGVKKLAKMPGKDEMRARLLSVLIGAHSTFLRLLNAAPSAFLRLLKAREESLEKGE